MTVLVYSYTIYHSPNAYLGTVLRRALAGLPGVELVRRPIYVPRDRGLMIAELLGGKENRNAGSYNREDCHRWSERFAIPMSYPDPSVFHEKRDLLEQALFEAAWVEGLDVNEPATIEWAAGRAGLDPESLITALAEPGPAEEVRRALAEFERLECPGVPPSSSTASASPAQTRSSTVSASSAKTGSIGSPISAAPAAELRVIKPTTPASD